MTRIKAVILRRPTRADEESRSCFVTKISFAEPALSGLTARLFAPLRVTAEGLRMTSCLLLVFLSMPLGAVDFRPPQRIITPNGANPNNQKLVFQNVTAGTTINIYDENGRKVRHMQGVSSWDGRDDDGNVVDSGVYIYQVSDQTNSGDRGIVSGIVAVAK